MQQADLVRVLQISTEEVLETMFFTSLVEEGMPGDSAATEPVTTPSVSSSLNFRGTPSGVFQVDLALPAAQSLAANFVGDEEPLSETKVGEVVCELANMLCGSVLSRVGSESSFDLSHPELVSRLTEGASARRSFDLPEGTLTVAVQLQD